MQVSTALRLSLSLFDFYLMKFIFCQIYYIGRAVTLLGAHSLGHMHIEVSGYGFVDDRVLPEALNAWDDTPAVLDNDYYVQLLKQVSVEAVLWTLWTR